MRFADATLAGAQWAFGRVGDGYVGVLSEHGMTIGDTGQYAGRELICYARQNTWVAECGRAADWGTFDAFVEALDTILSQGMEPVSLQTAQITPN